MDRKQVERLFSNGKVLYEFADNIILTFVVKLLYTILGIWALHNVLHSDDEISRMIGYILIVFSLWRIYCRGKTLIFLCETGIVVKRRPESLKEYIKTLFKEDSLYISVQYDKIVGFNQEWSLLLVGAVVVGGVYVIPVDLQYLNLKDKNFIVKFISKQKNDKDEEEQIKDSKEIE